MKPLVVLGLDLAGSPRRPTGVCLLRAFAAETRILLADHEIESFAVQSGPDLVTVDAPLNLPPGRVSFEDRSGKHYRPCDLELRARGIPFFPITLGPMRALTLRGIALKNTLEKRGIRVLEMYPGGAQDLWGIPRAKRDAKSLRRGLARMGLKGLGPRISEHELDAATGALVGRLFLQQQAVVYGDFETGAILMPRAAGGGPRRSPRGRIGKGTGK
jgi:hypothetical protein